MYSINAEAEYWNDGIMEFHKTVKHQFICTTWLISYQTTQLPNNPITQLQNKPITQNNEDQTTPQLERQY
jgi:hypothetical protein